MIFHFIFYIHQYLLVVDITVHFVYSSLYMKTGLVTDGTVINQMLLTCQLNIQVGNIQGVFDI